MVYVLFGSEHVPKVKEQLNSQTQFCDQTKCEILKYKIRLFTIGFSKNLEQLRRKEQTAYKKRLKILESNLNNKKMLDEYSKCKNKHDEIYGNMAEGVKVRSKSLWYEKG